MADARSSRARYRRILRFAARCIALVWWFELFLPRIGLARLSAKGRTARLQGMARRFHALAIDLGGLMIKVGQFMSSRLDVLPPEITSELAGLQDEVPAADFASIRTSAEVELGVPLERAYSFFDPTALAAASLGQAHRARLSADDAADTGFEDVVVKVQRPGIDVIVDVDLAALRRVAGWLSRVRVVSEHVDLPALVGEFALTSMQEIDYLHEAGNAERFAANFEGDARVSSPAIAWERTSTRVLTMSDVTAIKINDVDGLRAAGIDPSAVATQFANVMFDQLFEHGFFHADPHPGNIFVTPGAAAGAFTLTFVDFGMMGEVPDTLRRGLQKLIIAVASRNGSGLVASIGDVGVLLPSADTVQLERAMTELFDRFGGMGFAELQDVDPNEFRGFAEEFGDVVRAMPFQLPENFLLIIRAVSLISGVCTSLDSDFNIWNAVEPYAGRLMRAESGNTVRAFGREAVSIAGVAARLPKRLDDALTRLERGQVAVDTPRMERRMRELERTTRRVISAVLFAGLFIGGVLLRQSDAVLGVIVLAASAIPLLHALFAGRVGGRGRR